MRKGGLGNFTKLTEKHLCQSLLFNKVADLRPEACNFIKKETVAQVFSCEFCESFKNTFSYRTPLGDCFLCVMIHYENVIFRNRIILEIELFT